MAEVAPRRRAWKPAAERREEILEAAVRLFKEKGFDDSALTEIAAAAGVATGTVYLYYPSKEHILLAIHEQVHQEVASLLENVIQRLARARGADQLDFGKAIDGFIDTLVAYVLERRDAVEVITRYIPRLSHEGDVHKPDQDFVQTMARIMEAGKSAGLIHVSDPEMTALLLNAALRTTIGESLAYNYPSDLKRLVRAGKELVNKALAPAVGKKSLKDARP